MRDWIVLCGAVLMLVGCGGGSSQESTADSGAEAADPRRPRTEVVEALQEDLRAERHVADGGGSATLEILEPEDGRLRAGGTARLRVSVTVGPEGVAVGGAIFLQMSPFWGWSTPQVVDPGRPGFTTVSTEAEGVSLRPETVDRQLLAVHVAGRSLEPGEVVRLDYGAGVARARVDRFAESEERVWIAVDGDGDGVRALQEDAPSVEIGPGEAARLVAFLPSTARPGETVRLHVSVLDAWGNAGVPYEGTVQVENGNEITEVSMEQVSVVPNSVPGNSVPGNSGTVILPWTVGEPGVYRLRVSIGPDLRAETNPMWVAPEASSVFWGDLQVHSNRSDGTGLPADLYAYGRDVARLDVMAVTDHDHWGLRFLDQSPETWDDIQRVTEEHHEPGRFVTVRGFEWTHWLHGHRHVLVFDDGPLSILSSLNERYDHPTELWQALRGRDALTIAHHSAGGPIAIDWTIPPDPELEPITEVVSVHGSSEAADSPRVIYQPIAGNFVRGAALGRGYRLGLIGSTDGHDGHPGLAHLAGGSGGLAAILARSLTRADVLEALRSRRVYATSGPRILLRVLLAGYRMGSEIEVEEGRIRPGENDERVPFEDDALWVQAIAPGELVRLDVIDSRRGVKSVPCDGKECSLLLTVDSLMPDSWVPGEFMYVRAVQADDHFAISSPFFFVDSSTNRPPPHVVGSSVPIL